MVIKKRKVNTKLTPENILTKQAIMGCRIPYVVKMLFEQKAEEEGIFSSEYLRHMIYEKIGWDKKEIREKIKEKLLEIEEKKREAE